MEEIFGSDDDIFNFLPPMANGGGCDIHDDLEDFVEEAFNDWTSLKPDYAIVDQVCLVIHHRAVIVKDALAPFTQLSLVWPVSTNYGALVVRAFLCTIIKQNFDRGFRDFSWEDMINFKLTSFNIICVGSYKKLAMRLKIVN